MKAAGAIVFNPAGPEAEPVSTLGWAIFIGGFVILALVLFMLGMALFGPARWRARLGGERPMIALGLILPVIVLTALLFIGLRMTATLASSEEHPGALKIRVAGELWWWRMTYPGFETANELVVPVGRPVHLELVSGNVIHSFWVPQLAGKRDLVPGRVNRLNIQADEPGTYFGICAEYCGGPHALMQLRVHALEPAAYAAWEAKQRGPAASPASDMARLGAERFAAIGCGECHTIRGTANRGTEGPDLTHIASRSTIAAGILPLDRKHLTRWTMHGQTIKPDNAMPDYPYAPQAEIEAISAYLMELE